MDEDQSRVNSMINVSNLSIHYYHSDDIKQINF